MSSARNRRLGPVEASDGHLLLAMEVVCTEIEKKSQGRREQSCVFSLHVVFRVSVYKLSMERDGGASKKSKRRMAAVKRKVEEMEMCFSYNPENLGGGVS